jgi:hypothetical protein
MKTLALSLFAATTLAFAGSASASAADYFRFGGSYGARGPQHRGYGYGGSGIYNHHVPSYSQFGYGSHYGHHGSYHDTTHWDWHPTTIRRHGNHFDVMPGHYDLHRDGHWHH